MLDKLNTTHEEPPEFDLPPTIVVICLLLSFIGATLYVMVSSYS